MAGSASLSLVGTGLVIVSVLRFRELSKRFFAIRLITCLVRSRKTVARAAHRFSRMERPHPPSCLNDAHPASSGRP